MDHLGKKLSIFSGIIFFPQFPRVHFKTAEQLQRVDMRSVYVMNVSLLFLSPRVSHQNPVKCWGGSSSLDVAQDGHTRVEAQTPNHQLEKGNKEDLNLNYRNQGNLEVLGHILSTKLLVHHAR